ncbi:sulfotransferase family cytosolic 1B member 1 [Daphnia magna]|uniref:Sulfotransferase family cytosolic 1B member n=1 Tax=Daphnia magna TaxID=35525 RepID=A0A164X1K8_9CRUS|nr:sulfotransferase family cytosolic 1B member 1 [Daphnia magna]KZS13785.1 Sulfotransferase family cytosolic 1B member [Daphnia magna]
MPAQETRNMTGGRHPLNVKFIPIPETLPEDGQFRQDFPSYTDGLVEASPGGYITTTQVFAENAENIYNLKPRPDDVFVLTFPKSGTTWTQDLVWLLMNNCDFERSKIPLVIRSPFLEMNYYVPKALQEKYERDAIVSKMRLPAFLVDLMYRFNIMDVVRPAVMKIMNLVVGEAVRDLNQLERMKSPRVFKTHLPLYLLHPELLETSKVVYVARNPKDVIVSYFHFHKLMNQHKFTGDLESFADYFMKDRLYSSPYFPHLLDAWTKRHHPNLLFVFYEDLKRDLRGEILKIGRFLGKYPNEHQLNRMVEHLRIDKFANNKSVNFEHYRWLNFMSPDGRFIRKGKTGDWKNHFSPELNARIDDWMKSNLKDTDLSFITELEQQD